MESLKKSERNLTLQFHTCTVLYPSIRNACIASVAAQVLINTNNASYASIKICMRRGIEILVSLFSTWKKLCCCPHERCSSKSWSYRHDFAVLSSVNADVSCLENNIFTRSSVILFHFFARFQWSLKVLIFSENACYSHTSFRWIRQKRDRGEEIIKNKVIMEQIFSAHFIEWIQDNWFSKGLRFFVVPVCLDNGKMQSHSLSALQLSRLCTRIW